MYNLAQDDKKNYQDMFIKHALKEFDETFDYEYCDKKKLLNLEK
ncbi:39105_t:CDS:1, partial [Gigaspora margarita]